MRISKKQAKEVLWKLLSTDIGLKLLLIAAPLAFIGNCLGWIPEERAFSVMFLLIILLSLFELVKYNKIEKDLQEIDGKTDDIIDIKRIISEPPINVYRGYIKTKDGLKKYIEDVRPQNVYMVEYSSWCVQDLIVSLIETRTWPNIYLLIQHPKEGESIGGQKKRIWEQITGVFYQQGEFKDYPNLKILCYKQRASFRGRNFDDKLINIGWYIYRYTKDGKQCVHGHDQPTITFREGYEGFSNIRKMFSDAFKNLWENGIRLNEVCKEYEDELPLCSDPDFIKWCEEVSPKKEDRKIETKR
jgi:hypothetical protein